MAVRDCLVCRLFLDYLHWQVYLTERNNPCVCCWATWINSSQCCQYWMVGSNVFSCCCTKAFLPLPWAQSVNIWKLKTAWWKQIICSSIKMSPSRGRYAIGNINSLTPIMKTVTFKALWGVSITSQLSKWRGVLWLKCRMRN